LDATPAFVGLDGDFNLDARVDAADYVMWRRGYASPADYQLWRANFGSSASGAAAGQASRDSAGMPEPGAFAAVLIAINLIGICQRLRLARSCCSVAFNASPFISEV